MLATILLLIVWLGAYISWNISIEKLRDNSRLQLDQFIGHLDARLARFQFIPQLIAKNQPLLELLKDPQSTPRVDLVNLFLEDINNIIGASDTYLMDAEGMTLAASNWQDEFTFVGENFGFRPYFTDAMKGRLGRYFALGTTSGKRGYYFAYPITYAAAYLGVIVVKMDLSNIEQHWSQRPVQFMVTDPDGIIFITTQPGWLYHSIKPLSAETRQQILLSQHYSNIGIKNLEHEQVQIFSADSSILKINAENQTKNREYLTIRQEMSTAGWNVMILAPLNQVRQTRMITIVVLLMTMALLLLIAFLARQRYRRQQEKEHFQAETKKLLEQEVSVRTVDLRNEITEHKRTEKLLQDTQDELIQTAKLAVLGEMSASISHELNNPLAAIRSYTDNARKLLQLDKAEDVDENLNRITGLIERMGKISSQLKLFARKSPGQLEQVKVDKIIHSAIELVDPQFKHFNVRINIDQVEAGLLVLAEKIQLEQVLINLINNAMYSIGEQNQGEVTISTEVHGGRVKIHVDDDGPGIEGDNLGKIFEPFFTTRKTGMGLGLSISARIIESMQGHLSASNLDLKGARFSIDLQAVEKTT
ncbi:MAG: ATP-binding protein [Gammaproteobacteria bacterium]